MTDAETVALTALREAASALNKGSEAGDGAGDEAESGKPGLATEIAHILDGMGGLLRRSTSSPPYDHAGHNLHAVVHLLTAGSALARSVGRDSPSTPPELRGTPPAGSPRRRCQTSPVTVPTSPTAGSTTVRGGLMATTVLFAAVSLDGFIAEARRWRSAEL